MRTSKLIRTLATTALLVSLVGCNQDSTARKDLDKSANDAGDAVKSAADAVQQAGEAAANDVTKKAEEAAAPVNAKAQEVLDGARKLFNDGKLQEALAALKRLDSGTLSAEQHALATNLTWRINKMLGNKEQQ